MKFRIPFTLEKPDVLKNKSEKYKFLSFLNKSNLRISVYLQNASLKITQEEYLNIVSRSLFFSFIFSYVIATTILVLTNVRLPYLIGLGVSFFFSLFVIFSQINYPKTFDNRRVRNMEKNLIPALGDILVQLNSGVPLFNILVNISSSDYGELSEEFKKAVKKINAGLPQVEVLEELGEKNSSIYFKRTLWQISNGMRAGSDISVVISESIKSLSEEQILQIQNYGNKLNPMIMFYMLSSVILPALAITFLTIISSMVGLTQSITTLLFAALFVFVVIIQTMFIGIIKSIRPSLL